MPSSKLNLISNLSNLSIRKNSGTGGHSLEFTAIILLIAFNLLLTLFFNNPFSIHLDFFVALSFLILCFETTPNQLTPTSASAINKRHLLFALIMLLFVALAAIPISTTPFNQVLYFERIIRMIFSIVLMYVFYKSIHLDFGMLISLVLLANLLYQVGFKLILETVLATSYLEIIPGSEQIKEQVNTLIQSMQSGLSANPNTPSRTSPSDAPFILNPDSVYTSKNLAPNNQVMEIWFYTTLNFMGVIIGTLNIFFFIAVIKLVLNKTLQLGIHVSRIYVPSALLWFFIPAAVILYGWISFFGMPFLTTPHYPFSFMRFGIELLITFLIGCAILYLIQGISVGLGFFKIYNNSNRSSFIVVTITLLVAISFFIAPLFAIVFFDVLFSSLLLVGFTDQWIDYRKKIINYS